MEKALNYYHKSLKIQEEIGNKRGIAISLNNIGYSYFNLGSIPKALEYFSKSLKIQEVIGDKKGIATSLNNIGDIYSNQGDIHKALEYHHKSLKIKEEIGDKEGIAMSLNNIGYIYRNQGDFLMALEYQNKSLKIDEESGDKNGIARSLNNIANIYQYHGDPSVTSSKEDALRVGIHKALDYYTKSLKIWEGIGDKQGIAFSLNNIGYFYQYHGDPSVTSSKEDALRAGIHKALEYHHKSLKIRKEIGDKNGIAYSLNNLGCVYFAQHQVTTAKSYYEKAYQLSKELGFPDIIERTANGLRKVYEKQSNYKLAYYYHQEEIQMRDSIQSEKNYKESVQQHSKYEYEKKAATDSVANAKEIEIKNVELSKQQAEIKAKRNQQYALFGGLFLVVVFAGFMYNRFKVTQKQKVIIEAKEHETHAQKEIIEEKHKEITDSINYAERIQHSFLATTEMLDKYLGVTSSSPKYEGVSRSERNYFVFFRPKDVVSGDFYWAAELNNGNFAFTVADSTGHGVPGAIMSILNISSLEKSIETQTEPHHILSETRRIIIDRLKKDGSPDGGKDGMDCSLLVINKDRTQLSFAAANNPVFIVRAVTSSSPKNEGVSRSNTIELIEFKPDKMPVGKHENDTQSFTLHTALLQKGDVIYALTDGFPDQFGGDKGKKYMIKNLKELLLQIANLPMHQQEQKLADEFDRWKGSNEQVDDVCIIGVRV